ncbi:DUF1064 domain-containing protein [Heyndrickxia acidicola]|uniref:DUF1064 domain-containing protein n=1 Tax=Heyndrickxia acidicola TaxID=209389 RepID=UPI000826D73C
MPAKEYRKTVTKKRHKYGNKKTVVDGITFDSKAEAKYYEQLKWLEQAKEIKSFKLQPRYILQEGFVKNGKKYRKIEYVADFEVHKLDGTIEVIDIKGVGTKEFALKRKLFEAKYLDTLSVLAYDETFGFIELDKLKS